MFHYGKINKHVKLIFFLVVFFTGNYIVLKYNFGKEIASQIQKKSYIKHIQVYSSTNNTNSNAGQFFFSFKSTIENFANNISFGVVIVDVRPKNKFVKTQVLDLLHQVHNTVPNMPCEIWIGFGTKLLQSLLEYIEKNRSIIFIRYIPATYTNAVGQQIDLQNTPHGGHIGKSLALRDSAFQLPILLDSDSWPCAGWFEAVKNASNNADVIWSLAVDHFGASSGIRHIHEKSMTSQQQKDFENFAERNSGTVFMVRKSIDSKAWLTDAIETRVNLSFSQHRGKYSQFADQAAFRQSFFTHKTKFREHIFSAEKACRDIQNNKYQCGMCACKCSNCLFVHNKKHFARCSRDSYSKSDQNIISAKTSTLQISEKNTKRHEKKCAFIFFGLVKRFQDLVYPSIKKYLLGVNPKCDIFAHTWNISSFDNPRNQEQNCMINYSDVYSLTSNVALDDVALFQTSRPNWQTWRKYHPKKSNGFIQIVLII